jgi:hypothetical protein
MRFWASCRLTGSYPFHPSSGSLAAILALALPPAISDPGPSESLIDRVTDLETGHCGADLRGQRVASCTHIRERASRGFTHRRVKTGCDAFRCVVPSL